MIVLRAHEFLLRNHNNLHVRARIFRWFRMMLTPRLCGAAPDFNVVDNFRNQHDFKNRLGAQRPHQPLVRIMTLISCWPFALLFHCGQFTRKYLACKFVLSFVRQTTLCFPHPRFVQIQGFENGGELL
jgi:hypothetical protein